MYSRIVICYFNFVFWYIFCRLNANAASVSTQSEPFITTRRYISKNSTILVTTRSEFDGTVKEETCQCVQFYSCDKGNYYEIPNNPNACPSTDVCCKVQTPLDLDLDSAESPSTPSSSNAPETITSGTSDCRCIPRSECRISLAEKYGVGVVDIKAPSECPNKEEVCCPDEKITSSSTTETNQKLTCGERRAVIDIKVLGPESSSSTVFGEFPWMASIWKTNHANEADEFICGASLLSSNIVLTVAHYFNNSMKDNSTMMKVRVGDYDIKKAQKSDEEPVPYQEKSVFAMVIHPDFDSLTLFNDLAVIVTEEPFEFAFHVSPICTSLSGSEFADPKIYDTSNCIATGWGKSSVASKDKLTATLKKVDLRLVPPEECQEKLRRTPPLTKYFALHSSFLCAGGEEGLDTCKGDGGGPLFCPLLTNRHQYVQVGVTSWGVGCGNGTPGVYASLEANNGWLSSVYNKYLSSDRDPSNRRTRWR